MNRVKDIKIKENSELEQFAVYHAKYKMLYDFTPHGYFSLDREGNILELNQNAYKMLGLEDENSPRTKFIRYVTHDTQDIFTDFFQKVFETSQKQTCKVSIVNQESPEIYTQLEGMSFEDNTHCLILAIDFTDYELLKKKATRYQNIVESSKYGILTFDAATGKITDVNSSLTNIIGFDAEEIMGKNIWDISIFNEIISSREGLPDLENQLKNHYSIRRNGKVLELELFHNIYEFGNSIEIQLNFKDISERTQYLQALEESKKNLEEINAAKDKFFSIISHDLRNPISSIVGFSELLNEKIDQKDYAMVKQYGDIIQKSSWNALNLLSNLIEWSRSQSGKLKFNPEYFNLENLIDEVLNFSSAASDQKSITLEKKVSDTTVFADKAMLNTILRNLISNAIKFTYSGGKVEVKAAKEKSNVTIAVRDTGVGIEPQVLEKLFDRKEKYHTTGTNQEMGFGLGLELCKEFVKKHKGKIWAESILGKESTFYFTIPMK